MAIDQFKSQERLRILHKVSSWEKQWQLAGRFEAKVSLTSHSKSMLTYQVLVEASLQTRKLEKVSEDSAEAGNVLQRSPDSEAKAVLTSDERHTAIYHLAKTFILWDLLTRQSLPKHFSKPLMHLKPVKFN